MGQLKILLGVLGFIAVVQGISDDTCGALINLSHNETNVELIKALYEIIKTHTQENTALQQLAQQQNDLISQLRNEMAEINYTQTAMNSAVRTELLTTISNSNNNQSNEDSFHADFVSGRHNVDFTDVKLNSRNSYDASSGLFTAKIHGYYFFSTGLLPMDGREGELIITKDPTTTICRMYRAAHHQATAGCSGMVELQTNDVVFVDPGVTDANNVVEARFSGFLVAPAGSS